MYATVFVLTVITDFWANWYSYAIVHDWIITQAFLGLALPFLNLPGVLFFIDQKDMKIRLKLCAVSAAAMMIGSTAMLLMIRAGIGVGKDMIPRKLVISSVERTHPGDMSVWLCDCLSWMRLTSAACYLSQS